MEDTMAEETCLNTYSGMTGTWNVTSNAPITVINPSTTVRGMPYNTALPLSLYARPVSLPFSSNLSQSPPAPQGLLQSINVAVSQNTKTKEVKSMPIHLIVEQIQGGGGATSESPENGRTEISPDKLTPPTHAGRGCNSPVIEMDTYAILPGTTMFCELVRTALIKIGYTSSEALGAKGSIQIKKWKPLSFDTITDNPNVTLDEVLGDMTSIATLRIRLCSQSKVIAIEEVKEKLLQFLLDRSQMVLTSLGCPIEKKLLAQISRGDLSAVLPDGSREAFNQWFRSQMEKNNIPPPAKMPKLTHNISPVRPEHRPIISHPQLTSVSSSANSFISRQPHFDNSSLIRSRVRTSFDSENEIPRLNKWFALNQHPSRDQMLVYLDELNSLASRKGQNPLDLTNIIYWFKNARAASRRNSKLSPGGADDPANDTNDENTTDNTNDVSVPELPNRNAIYVVNPLLQQEESEDAVEVIQPNEGDEDHANDDDDDDDDHRMNYYKRQRIEDLNETNNNCVDLEQEEATDLSVRKSLYPRFHHIKKEECERDYLSATSSSPSPSPNSMGTPNSLGHPPISMQSTHTALQMAAMSHALSMHHYMHPASLYQSPSVLSYGNDGSSHSPSDSDGLSLSDRKKRSRVFIDPLSEIPKLEKWFEEDTHPSSYMIEKYTEELNNSPYRLRFPKLEPKNVQLWFKNHRAKVKRQRLGMDVTSPSPSLLDNDSMLHRDANDSMNYGGSTECLAKQ